MRQTGSGKIQGQRLKITADKDQPARKVSSWNPTRNNITAEKHQPTREWLAVETPLPGERIEIRVLKYKVQRTTAYAATTLTLSTVFHLKPRCHANMVTLDTPTCSERFPAWFSFTQSLINFCVLIGELQFNVYIYCCYPPMSYATTRSGSTYDALHLN